MDAWPGLTNTAMRAASGTNSRRSPSRFAARSAAKKLTPVRLPPGRAKLSTRPSLTGSLPVLKTMVIIVVAALAACADGVSIAAMTATRRRTRSTASAGSRSVWFSAQRYSIATLSPSSKARLLQALAKSPQHLRDHVRRLAVEEPDHRHRRLLRARRERPAPPRRRAAAMNSRRFIRSPRRRAAGRTRALRYQASLRS